MKQILKLSMVSFTLILLIPNVCLSQTMQTKTVTLTLSNTDINNGCELYVLAYTNGRKTQIARITDQNGEEILYLEKGYKANQQRLERIKVYKGRNSVTLTIELRATKIKSDESGTNYIKYRCDDSSKPDDYDDLIVEIKLQPKN